MQLIYNKRDYGGCRAEFTTSNHLLYGFIHSKCAFSMLIKNVHLKK